MKKDRISLGTIGLLVFLIVLALVFIIKLPAIVSLAMVTTLLLGCIGGWLGNKYFSKVQSEELKKEKVETILPTKEKIAKKKATKSKTVKKNDSTKE